MLSFTLLTFSISQTSTVYGQEGRLTLVSKSTGLNNPIMEEGNTELEMADINGDGHLDIVSVGDHGSPYVNSGEHGIMVWLGDGKGHWAVHQVGNFGYGGCAVGDLNLDGHLDVAWGIHHDWGSGGFGDKLMGAALGNGSGSSWTPWGKGLASNGETWGMFATALADFDCNGRLDMISQSFGGSNGLRLYENHGDGTWSQAWALTGGSVAYTIETCDINADGYPDMVTTRKTTNVLLGDGSFGFTVNMKGLPSGSIYGVDVGDMNSDGCDDLVFSLYGSGIRCYQYQKSLDYWVSASNGLPTSGNFQLTQFGDLDGDGALDITAYSSPKGYLFLGDGSGNWTPDATWTMPSPGDASALRVDGDMDHDGREDIAVLAVKSGFPVYHNQLRVYSPWLEPVDLSARVTAPHGGECFRNGSIRFIRWVAAIPGPQGQATVTIRLSQNGASGPWTTIATGLPDNGCYQWLVDASPSPTCRIEIEVTTAVDTATDMSAADFSIVGESLWAEPAVLSEQAGGVVNFTLDAGALHGNRNYLLLGSVTGTAPGIPLPGGMATLPLNWDPFTKAIVLLLNSPMFADFMGTLDGGGEASALWNTNGPLPAGSAGYTVHFAYALNAPWDFVSNPVAVNIVP